MKPETLEDRLAALLDLQRRVDGEIIRVRSAIRDTTSKPRQRRSRHERPPCGTEQGYQWHRTRKQDADDDCKSAHASHVRVTTLARRLRGAA